jgi:hypothetical protein
LVLEARTSSSPSIGWMRQPTAASGSMATEGSISSDVTLARTRPRRLSERSALYTPIAAALRVPLRVNTQTRSSSTSPCSR